MSMFAVRIGTPDYDQSPAAAGGLRQALPGGRELLLETRDRPAPLRQLQLPDGHLLILGHPLLSGQNRDDDALRDLATRLPADPVAAVAGLDGQFALAWISADGERVVLATDRFASYPLYYHQAKGQQLFSTDYRWLSERLADRRIDDQAIYDYLFFTTVPSNRCLHAGIRRLLPASLLLAEAGRERCQRYWQPDFRHDRIDRETLEQQLRASLEEAVQACIRPARCGGFLSGGLDSSTVCGLAGTSAPGFPVYTMGFDEPGYDETAYARVTARHFGLALHEYQVTADEVLARLQEVTAALPEPFGNPSLLSTLICAQVAAADGIELMLAGDGGDELFAGNERYAKQLVFERYQRLPQPLRQRLLDPLGRWLGRRELGGLAGRAGSYLRGANTPLPRRMYRYNLLERYAPAAALQPGFLARIDSDAPLAYLERLYQAPQAGDFLDRLLYLDWTVTLADNDLRKVRAASELAGVHTLFPMLHLPVVEVSMRIPSAWKLQGGRLRAFYKRALRDFLPEEIIRKPKHGFGVPVGGWLRRHPELRRLVHARLARLKQREILAPAFIDRIITAQREGHSVYFGALLWPMFMLECWLAEHAPDYGAGR